MAQSGKINTTTIHADAGLLLLRIGIGLTMFMQHGMPYLINYEEQASRFLPFFGLDARASLAAVILTEVGCSLLIVLGCHMRLAALALCFAMAVAFVLVHGASFQGEQSGELAFIYLIASLTLVITGPGRYALNLNKRFSARSSRII